LLLFYIIGKKNFIIKEVISDNNFVIKVIEKVTNILFSFNKLISKYMLKKFFFFNIFYVIHLVMELFIRRMRFLSYSNS